MTALYSEWLAVGGDPDRFWSLTPRLFMIELRAMSRRRAAERAAMTEAAWVAFHADHSDMVGYCDRLLGVDRTLPPEALAGAIERAGSGLREMTWAEARKLKAH